MKESMPVHQSQHNQGVHYSWGSPMLATMYNTGARVSEVLNLNFEDLQLGPTTTLRIHGKGRKERVIPLWKTTTRLLRQWIPRICVTPGSPLFPSRRGERLTRTGVRSR